MVSPAAAFGAGPRLNAPAARSPAIVRATRAAGRDRVRRVRHLFVPAFGMMLLFSIARSPFIS
jgi:hypothetical protein